MLNTERIIYQFNWILTQKHELQELETGTCALKT